MNFTYIISALCFFSMFVLLGLTITTEDEINSKLYASIAIFCGAYATHFLTIQKK